MPQRYQHPPKAPTVGGGRDGLRQPPESLSEKTADPLSTASAGERDGVRGRPRDLATLLAPASFRPLCLAAIFLAACVHAPPPRPARVVTEPLKIVASPSPWGPRAEAYDAETLFRRGNAELSAGRHAAATPLYARLLAEFPGTRFTVPALYNAGLAAGRVR